MNMKMSSAAIALACIFALNSPTQASASVIASLQTSPGGIQAGQSVQVDLELSLTADSGDFGAQFSGGTVTISSGSGLSQSFIISNGGTSENFVAYFAYPSSGTFALSASGNTSFTEYQTSYGITGYTQVQVPTGQYIGYSCNTYNVASDGYWCYAPVYTYESVPQYGIITSQVSQDAAIHAAGSLSVKAPPPVSVPEPAGLALFGSGVLALGVARRRVQAAQG